MRDAILTSLGALFVAFLNEIRAQLRARQHDRDRGRDMEAAARRALQDRRQS